MPQNLFDQLKQTEVPPAPTRLDRQVHQRLNRRLVWLHMFDLAFRGLPYALGHFAAAVGGLLWMSLTGRFPQTREKPGDESDSAGD